MMKWKYPQEYDIAPPVKFGDHIVLDIPDDGVEMNNGWRIVPLQRTIVSTINPMHLSYCCKKYPIV